MFGPSASEVALYSGALLSHTYTRTPVTDSTENDWGEQSRAPGATTASQPCLYRTSSNVVIGGSGQRVTINEGGIVTVNQPSLFVTVDDPLAAGDKVSNIRNAAGELVAAGPFTVDTIETRDMAGARFHRRASLRSSAAR